LGKQKRGLAALSPERRREIAAMGGRAAQEAGIAHSFTFEEAVAAGRKGGQSLSRDRKHMAEIGRRGGFSKAGRQPDEIDNSELSEPSETDPTP
jgi:general stress protein YciG